VMLIFSISLHIGVLCTYKKNHRSSKEGYYKNTDALSALDHDQACD
jgi:hypothetical protein